MIKKIITILIVLVTGMVIIFTPTYAGSINGPEAGLIGKASGTFTYNGAQYKAKSQYIGQLKSYLSQDSIDLSQAQADKAASLMYSNVEGAVLDGVLEPVGSSSDSKPVDNSQMKEGLIQGIKKEKAGESDLIISDLDSTVKIETAGNNSGFTSQLPVKNTGFDVSGSVILLLFLISIIPLGMITAWKKKLFKHQTMPDVV